MAYNCHMLKINGLDKFCIKHDHKDYTKKAGKKRSTAKYLAERTVHWLKGSLRKSARKVASEPGFRKINVLDKGRTR